MYVCVSVRVRVLNIHTEGVHQAIKEFTRQLYTLLYGTEKRTKRETVGGLWGGCLLGPLPLTQSFFGRHFMLKAHAICAAACPKPAHYSIVVYYCF